MSVAKVSVDTFNDDSSPLKVYFSDDCKAVFITQAADMPFSGDKVCIAADRVQYLIDVLQGFANVSR